MSLYFLSTSSSKVLVYQARKSPFAGHVTIIDQSEASHQVTWPAFDQSEASITVSAAWPGEGS